MEDNKLCHFHCHCDVIDDVASDKDNRRLKIASPSESDLELKENFSYATFMVSFNFHKFCIKN